MTPRSGATGLILNPTASHTHRNSGGLAFSYFTDEAPMGQRTFRSFNGAFSPLPDLEVSAFRAEWAGPVKLDTNGVYIRYTWPSLRGGSTLAVGAGLYQGDLDGWAAHLMLNQPLTPQQARRRVDLHTGLAWTTWRGGRFRGEDVVPFIGVSGKVTDRLSLNAEVRAKEDWALKNAHAFGVHLTLGKQWHVTLGMVNTGFSKTLRPYVGISWGISVFMPR